MTVVELMEKLKELPQDADVLLPFRDEANVVVFDSQNNEVEILY